MRSLQRSVPAPESDSFLVVKISKRAPLYLTVGMIAVAAAFILRPAKIPAPQTHNDATLAAPPEPAALAANEREAQDVHSDSTAADVPAPPMPPSTISSAPSSEPTQTVTSPLREPSSISAVAHGMVYYPSEPATASPPANSSNAVDSPANLPDDSNTQPSGPHVDPPPSPPPPTTSPLIVTGAGSRSPYPLYSKWFDAFRESHPDVQFNYQPVGSAAGLKQLIEGRVSFAAVDAPLTDQQLKLAKIPMVHIPSVIGGVVLTYNIPGIWNLRLTPRIVAGIFMGKITSWNDPQIVAYNRALSRLPPTPITVIHRTDGCASTQIFSNYLSQISADWQHQIGEGTSLNWPTGLGEKGDDGVSRLLSHYPGAISYTDFQYASANQMHSASVQNRSGHFVDADLRTLSLAAASSQIPDDFRVWITNAPGSDAYPIASFMWFLAPEHSSIDSGTRDFEDFLRWTTRKQPQTVAAYLGYAPLPEELLDRVNQAISQLH